MASSRNSRDCSLSSKYTEYISHNIDTLKSKCEEFTVCINDLLSQQSAFSLISGDNIELKTICGMIQVDESNNTNQTEGAGPTCSSSERDDIKRDIEGHLNSNIREQQSWNRVKKCLGNNYGDKERSTYVNEICGLARRQKTLCRKIDIHSLVETFFNEEIHHLRCTCESLNARDDSSSAPIGAIVAGVIGGLVVLVLVVLLGIFCCKYKKAKKKKSSPSVIYLPAPNADNYPLYQEVDPYDPRYQPSPPNNPPTLPNRYTEEPTYLEPVPPGHYRGRALPPVINNPNYGDPPEYSEKEEAAAGKDQNKEEEGNEYLEPLPEPPEPPKEDEAYDTLLRNDEESENVKASYEPFNSFRAQKLGPSPAERTKKDERQQESTYFELEKGSDIEEEATPEMTSDDDEYHGTEGIPDAPDDGKQTTV